MHFAHLWGGAALISYRCRSSIWPIPMRRPRRHQRKTYAKTQFTGQRGVNIVERIVLEMGYVWNATYFEAGIDGYIEIADPETGEATNKIVQVQVKAVENDFQSDNGQEFSFTCERAHIDYWLNGTAPVILVVCKIRTGEAYWVNVADFFSDPERRKGCTIRFDRKSDRFDSSAANRLLESAAPEGGLYLGPVPKEEKLISNLFPVFRMPERIFVADTEFRDRDEVVEALKPLERPEIREWMLKDRKLYSIHDLRREPLVGLCDRGTAEPFDIEEWSDSDDPVVLRDFVRIMNLCLGQFRFDRGFGYDHESGKTFFAAPIDGSERRIQCQSLEKTGTRTVVKKLFAKEGSDDVPCLRHQAFLGKFLRFNGQWFLEVTPTHFFSTDGRTPYRYAESLESGLKRIERHRSVVGDLLMWKSVLAGRELGHKYRHLEFNAPAEFELAVGIDDKAWQRGEEVDDDEGPTVVDDQEDQEELQEMLW